MALTKASSGSSKKLIITVVIVLVIVAAVGFFFVENWMGSGQSSYDAVYLNTGDIYFGKLHLFPKPYLTDVVYLQRGTTASGQTQLGLSQFSSAFWGPADVIYLNPEQIEFWAPLRSDSQLVPILENPSQLNQQAAAQGQPSDAGQGQPSAPTTTTTTSPSGK